MPLITRNLNVIGRCSAQYRDVYLAPLGLNSCRAPYVLFICRNPGIIQEDVAKALHVNRSSATRQLSALEEDGFITRTPCINDKRTLIVDPTDKAQQAAEKIRRVNSALEEWLTKDMSEEEKIFFEKLLQKVVDRATTLSLEEDAG